MNKFSHSDYRRITACIDVDTLLFKGDIKMGYVVVEAEVGTI